MRLGLLMRLVSPQEGEEAGAGDLPPHEDSDKAAVCSPEKDP